MRTSYVPLVGLLVLALGCGSWSPASRLVCADNWKQAGLARGGDALGRQVIYTADLQLIVEDFGKTEVQLVKLAKDQKGFVAQSQISGPSNRERTGHWTMRVPVDQFETFLGEVVKLGIEEMKSTDSQTVLDSKDVTAERADIDALIRNKKLEEDRLLKHLDKSTGKLDEILTVEKELTRVRGEIDQNQRRLRELDNLITFATVSVTMSEVPGYVPAETQTLGAKAATAFQGSLRSLLGIGTQAIVIIATLVPWLPVTGLAIAVVWLMVRYLRPRAAVSPS
jgi:hypothetical protein